VRANGQAVVHGLLGRKAVSELRAGWASICADHELLLQLIDYSPEGGVRGATHGGLGTRLEAIVPCAPPIDPALVLRPQLLEIARACVGEESACLEMAAVIESRLGSEDQRFHTDMHLQDCEAALVPPTHARTDATAPPAAAPNGCIIAIPLVDVREENGPFEALSGTHGWPKARIGELFAGTDPACVPPGARPVRFVPLRAGSAIVYRRDLLHRGRANRSDEPRPVLFFSFVPRALLEAGAALDEHDYLLSFAPRAHQESARWFARAAGGGVLPADDPRLGSAMRREYWLGLADRFASGTLEPPTLRDAYARLARDRSPSSNLLDGQ
jgi:hypothetical protein